MLNPNNDRLDYGSNMLTAPMGYKFDFAIGTTYTLDLDALVGACIALGLSEDPDSGLASNPVFLLDALNRTGDSLCLFCEGGQISLPNNVTSLYALLEKVVFQVGAAKKQWGYPSFHPKFWLIRYVDDNEEVMYRIVVLSRNLTFDHSWDVSFCMDGKLGRRTAKNNPVIDFLNYLKQQMPEQGTEVKKNKIDSIMEELKKVNFETESRDFQEFYFMPTGIPNAKGKNYDMRDEWPFREEDSFDELLIMSPFLSESVINLLNNNCNQRDARCALFTRKSELKKLKPESCSNMNIYALRDNVIDGESNISGEKSNYMKQDIHAKLYMVREGNTANLLIGSLNASTNALNNNVEFMVCLVGRRSTMNIDKLEEDLFCGEYGEQECPFEEVHVSNKIEPEVEDKSQALVNEVKTIFRLHSKAVINKNGDFFDVCITSEHYETDYTVTIRSMQSKIELPFTDTITFNNLKIEELSEFYVVTVKDSEGSAVSRVIKIETEGMPEDRIKTIINDVITTKESFYRYLMYLLGDDVVLSTLDVTNEDGLLTDGTQGTRRNSYVLPPIYEKMLKVAANEPQRFKAIEDVINSISKEDIISEEFNKLYTTFKKAVE